MQGPFHISPVVSKNPSVNHFRYWEGLDWDRIAYQYAIVDPMDPYSVLYLTEREYNQLLRVALTMETTLLVIARPGDEPPQDFQQKKTKDLNKIPPLAPAPLLQDRYWRSSLSELIELKGTMVVLHPDKLEVIITRYSKLVASYAGLALRPSLLKSISSFCHTSERMIRSEGINTYILRLKITKLALEMYLAGSRADTRALGLHLSVSKAGLPRWLPLQARQAFLNRSVPNIRFWLSILNIYRAVEGVYKDPDFSSIVTPMADIDSDLLFSFQGFVRDFVTTFKLSKSLKVLRPRKFPILTSSSGVNPGQSVLSAGAAARLWGLQKKNHLLEWLDLVEDSRGRKMFNLIYLVNRPWADWYRRRWISKRDLFLGRLHLKYEPAGKVRVFAMVDYWTQYALLPLHNTLFQILSIFGDSDATFDQNKAVKTFIGKNEYYSYDLTSATDMIPIQLYKLVLDVIFGAGVGNKWVSLLTDRDFGMPIKDPKNHTYYTYDNKFHIRYGRGQPMGALSSWASLALVHHLLVQYAAYRLRVDDKLVLFDNYRVLGDDIVIGCAKVAQEYLLICKEFSIPIGLAKSVISPPSSHKGKKGWRLFQFANQIVFGPENISPISLKEEIQSNTLSSRLEIISKLVDRGWNGPVKILSFYLRSLNPRRWRLGTTSLTEGRIPLFVKSLLPLLLSPMSKDVGLTGLSKYYAWYQVLSGSYNFANLLNHKFWLSVEELNKHKHFIEFLSERSQDIYRDILLQQSRFGGEDQMEKLIQFDPVSSYSDWIKYCEGYLEYPLSLADSDVVNRQLLDPESQREREGLHKYWEEYKYSCLPLLTVELPTNSSSVKPKKKKINVNYMNLPLVKEVLSDYYKTVKENISPLLKIPKDIGGGVDFNFMLQPLAPVGFRAVDLHDPFTPSAIIFSHIIPDPRDTFALLTRDEFKEYTDVEAWDGTEPLYPTLSTVESLPRTLERLEELLKIQKLYSLMNPEDILKRTLSEVRPRFNYSTFVKRLMSQKGKTFGARDLFLLKEKIVPSLPGV